MVKSKFIYSLYFQDFPTKQSLEEGPDDVVFYIGKSENPDRRLKEHKYKSKRGSEDVYKFIRFLEKNRKEWDMEIIRKIEPGGDDTWERRLVIEAVEAGSPLKNMRHGDLKNVSQLAKPKLGTNSKIRDTKSLKNEGKSDTNDYDSSTKLQQKIVQDSLRFLRREGEMKSGNLFVWEIYDTGEGTEEIKAEKGMKKSEIAELITPAAQQKILEIKRNISVKFPLRNQIN